MSSRSRMRRCAGALAALGLGALASAALAELALRVHNPIPLPLRGREIVLPVHKRFVYRSPRPGTKIDPQIHFTANSLGFRGPERPPDFEQRLTVIAVGGSTTECRFLSDGRDWPARLGVLLEPQLGPVWVNNAGFDGHSTFGHFRLLEQVVLDLRPDYVLFMVGINDVGRADLLDYDAEIEPGHSAREWIVSHSELLSTLQVLRRTLRAIELGLDHYWELDLAAEPTAPVREQEILGAIAEHRARYLEPYRERLERLVAMTRERGIEPILVTQPALFAEGADQATGIAIGPRLHGGETAAQAWRLLELYNDVTREVAARQEVLAVDLAAAMPKDSSLYYDWIHYTNEGAGFVARTLAGELVPFFIARGERGDTPELATAR